MKITQISHHFFDLNTHHNEMERLLKEIEKIYNQFPESRGFKHLKDLYQNIKSGFSGNKRVKENIWWAMHTFFTEPKTDVV